MQRPRALCIHTRLGCAAGARAFWRFNGQAGAVGSGNVLVTGANVVRRLTHPTSHTASRPVSRHTRLPANNPARRGERVSKPCRGAWAGPQLTRWRGRHLPPPPPPPAPRAHARAPPPSHPRDPRTATHPLARSSIGFFFCFESAMCDRGEVRDGGWFQMVGTWVGKIGGGRGVVGVGGLR